MMWRRVSGFICGSVRRRTAHPARRVESVLRQQLGAIEQVPELGKAAFEGGAHEVNPDLLVCSRRHTSSIALLFSSRMP